MKTIDQLPTELLMDIFRCLPQLDAVSLVNKRFYDVACALYDSKNWMRFSSVFLENGHDHQSILDSIETTQRKISKLNLNLCVDKTSLRRQSATSDAIKIVKKFSETIKYLQLDHFFIEMSDYFEILKSLPNVEHLILTDFFENRPLHIKIPLRNDYPEYLHLQHLKTLTLIECDEEFEVAFDKLPANVLNKLSIERRNIELDSFTGLLMRQTNIKQLTLIGSFAQSFGFVPVSDKIFDILRLESLELQQSEFNSIHATILSKQTKLKSLILRQGYADGVVVNFIANELTELETLHLNIADASTIKNVVKLTKLKDLTFGIRSSEMLEIFAGLDNSRITTLNIICEHRPPVLTVDRVGKLAKSVPNLKVLRIYSGMAWQSFIAITRHFNFIGVLEVKSCFLSDFDKTMDGWCVNPNLTELKIDFELRWRQGQAFLEKLISVYPNLKKLDFTSSMTTQQFKFISNRFRKMESLKMRYPKSDVNFFNCLDHINNLKSITFTHLNKCDADELKTKLRLVYEVMNYENGTLYMSNKKVNRLL